VQVLRVDWPVYPRRAEHNTVTEGGIEDGPRLPVSIPSSRGSRRSKLSPGAWA